MIDFEYRDRLKVRTPQFALGIIRIFEALPKTSESQIIGKQLLCVGTSVAANYRTACRGDQVLSFKVS